MSELAKFGLNASNEEGSKPVGKPKTATIFSTVNSDSIIRVVVGFISKEPDGALNVTPDRTDPDELSTVVPSVIATIE